MVNNVEQMEYWVSPPLWHGLLNPRPMDELYPCGVAFLLPSPSVQPNWEVAHLAVRCSSLHALMGSPVTTSHLRLVFEGGDEYIIDTFSAGCFFLEEPADWAAWSVIYNS